jgi:hypothetical protein
LNDFHDEASTAATCNVFRTEMDAWPMDRSGQAVALPIRIISRSDRKTLGTFGVFDMKSFPEGFTNYQVDVGTNYFNATGILFRFAP